VLRLKPEHISAYSLIIEKGTPFYDRYKFDLVRQEAGIKTDILPTEDEICKMMKLTKEAIKAVGYEHYEVSNFAKPGYACRHNIGYWKRENYLGVGLGAASMMENVRYTNTKELYDYLKMASQIHAGVWHNDFPDGTSEEVFATNLHIAAEKISRNGQMEEFMFLGLRMIQGVARADFEQAFGIPIEGIYPEVLQKLASQNLLVKRAGQIYLTERGQNLSNYVLAQFLLS
jgi:oxygen-independent coproporphyrinogen-3 oxidase